MNRLAKQILGAFSPSATRAFNESSPDISIIIATALTMKQMDLNHLMVIIFMSYCAGYRYGMDSAPLISREQLLKEVALIVANEETDNIIKDFFNSMELIKEKDDVDDMLKDVDFGDW